MEEEAQNQDICRVCRCEATNERPLFHPCICTGSIKFIHQDCLVQWLRYSRKEYCELCKHRISFTPIYSPDMPKRLPIADILSGLARSMGTAIRYWLHYTLVAVAWLGIVPLSACRIYRCLFTGSVASLFTLPLDLLSSENLMSDIFHGCFVVTCTLSAFISLVWLREQILHGGGPDWLDQEIPNEPEAVPLLNGGEAMRLLPNNNEPAAPNNEVAIQEGGEEIPPNHDAGAEQQNAVEPVNEGLPAAVANNNNIEQNGAADDINWNPIEWDRAAEELTWERLLGLDGSLLFLEHVFWVISLNTMFILVFAFCPYHIGHFTVVELQIQDYVKASHFEGLLTTLCGYCVVGVIFVILHSLAALVKLSRSKRVLGLCYIVVKVALLSVVEIGVFPLVGGWWLDICSLSLFDASLKERETSFKIAPGTSMFIHWLVGMVYVFYFASFILLLREVLRPGVLWFLRNLNDPDFNPVQEIFLPFVVHISSAAFVAIEQYHKMIHLPIIRHTRRFLASMIIFGSTVLLMLWLPIRIIHSFWPSFLPYHITLSSETPVSELSLELLLLQVILPALLEQGHTRVWLKVVIRYWCSVVSHIFGLRSYLLGDLPLNVQNGGEVIRAGGAEIPEDPNIAVAAQNEQAAAAPAANGGIPNLNQRNPPAVEAAPIVNGLEDEADAVVLQEGGLGGGLGAAHQALLQREGPTGFQPYLRPPWFGLRIIGLVILMCFSLTGASVLCLTVPVWVGRKCMNIALGDTKVHELYTGACGLYLCLLGIRFLTLIASWFALGWTQVLQKLKHWGIMGLKSGIALIVVAGVIPLMVGILIEFLIVIPLRVPLHQTPILFFWQDWALGVLYAKIVCAIVMMGPNWWLKTHLEQIYLGGIRNLDLNLIVRRTALPVVSTLGACLAFPYVCAKSVAPFFVPGNVLIMVERRIYPALLVISVITSLAVMQIMQFTRLYEHIKNDKYLVGRRLVNYYHSQRKSSESQQSLPSRQPVPPVNNPHPPPDENPPEQVPIPPVAQAIEELDIPNLAR